jgi:Single-strand binding protein family
MTAFALITGVIFRNPMQKTSKAGKPYTTCTVKAGSDDGAGGDFWSVLCFSESAQVELLRLEVGDAISVRGKMKIEIFEARISRSIFADVALGLRRARNSRSPRSRRRRRKKPPPLTRTSMTRFRFERGNRRRARKEKST